MKQLLFIFWMFYLSLSCHACGRQLPAGSSPAGSDAPTAVATETAFLIPAGPAPWLNIEPERQNGETISVPRGEAFAIVVPSGFPTWQISYAGTVIQPLTPLEEMQVPGPQGWLFRSIASGQTEVRLTAPALDCDPGAACPPASPITFVVTIEVK